MIKKFQYIKECSGNFIQEMRFMNDSMLDVLIALDDGDINKDGSPLSMPDLTSYIQSLVIGQRGSLGRTKAGSWGLVPDDTGMDADARVEFIFKPTYIAVATLTRFAIECPSSSFDNDYENALRNGMLFCTYRNLSGHGYENDDGKIEALTILSLGKVPLFLINRPDFCPELKKTIDDVANDMASRLENGTANGCWGTDYSKGFRTALETLYLLNDRVFMDSINQSENNVNLIGKDDLPW